MRRVELSHSKTVKETMTTWNVKMQHFGTRIVEGLLQME